MDLEQKAIERIRLASDLSLKHWRLRETWMLLSLCFQGNQNAFCKR